MKQEIEFKQLKNKIVKQVFINDKRLVLQTDQGDFTFLVYGDCCSDSYFHDFLGADKIIGHKIIYVEKIELKEDEKKHTKSELENSEVTEWYGYRIVVEHPDFGEVSATLSFRNESNGHYGGWMELYDENTSIEGLKEVKVNWLND